MYRAQRGELARVGDEIGILGIDFGTRRRNRANGIVSSRDAAGFTAVVRQSFGNCPQYIQRRVIVRADAGAGPARELSSLDGEARSLIQRADTFFVASRSRADVGPRASLLFLDFANGDLLQLQGLASIDWSDSAAELVQGAERVWQFRVTRGWYRPGTAALRGPWRPNRS